MFKNFIEYQHITITVNCKESIKTGAISYSAKINYTGDMNIKRGLKTVKCYSVSSLRDDIIAAQNQIF